MSPAPLYGSTGPDLLQIGPDADTIYGDDGHDTIKGLGGDDALYGELGRDLIRGGTGRDLIDGSDGDDRLWGGAGRDTLVSGWGQDIVYGGIGDDTIIGGIGNDVLFGDGGDDHILISDSSETDDIRADGGDGDDLVVYVAASIAHLRGGDGQDTLGLLWVTDLFANIGDTLIDLRGPVQIAGSTGTGGAGPLLDIAGFEALQVQLDNGDDTVFALGGDDVIAVEGGDNLVEAGDGQDEVAYVVGGRNTLDGGDGDDVLVAIGDVFTALTFDASGPDVQDGSASILTGFERFVVLGSDLGDRATGGALDDSLAGYFGRDTLAGGGGGDRLRGQWGADVLHGDAGDDRMFGGHGSDTLYGGADGDRLSGGSGNDYMFGGAGDDTLMGGRGTDELWGDDGADTFRFATLLQGADAEDMIRDFTSGVDRIVVVQSLLMNAPATGQVMAGDLIYGTSASGPEGKFLYVISGSTGLLFWDGDGTGTDQPQLITGLETTTALDASDIWIV